MSRKVYLSSDGIECYPDSDWDTDCNYESYGTGGEVDIEELKKEQSAKSDFGKAKLSLVPRKIIWNIAAIREYGNNKYPKGGPDNWKTVKADRYRDAAFRHFLRYLDNPSSVDDESGLPHLWHLACNIAFLCELEAEDKESDKESIALHEDGGSIVGYNEYKNKYSITIDDRVSITTPKAERTEESPERDCTNCKCGLPGASFEKCLNCYDGYTNWEPKTEEENEVSDTSL